MAKPDSYSDALGILDKDPAAAEKAARAMVVNRPNDWKAILLLGRALRAQGKDVDATLAERRAVQAATLDPRHRSAAREMQQGRAFEANGILKKLLDEDRDDVLAAVMLGLQASKANEFEIADELLRRAVALAPGDPGTRLALADHYFRSKRFAAALGEVRALDDADRQSEAAQNLLANCLGEMGQVEAQLAIFEKLAKTASNPLSYNLKIGLALRTLGRFDEAAKNFRAVIARVPAEGTSWHNLANLKVEKFSDSDIAKMLAGLELPNAPIENHIRLNFALGKAFEDRGEAERAFSYYDAGNKLRQRIAPYDPEMISQWVERSEAAFTAEFFEKRRGWGNPARDPIFVIGMQRSGSTLVEQILASHPQVEGTAELTELPNIVRSLGEAATAKGLTYEADVSTFDVARLYELGTSYLDETKAHRHTGEPYFSDKMPNNWMHVSLIRLILPNARIIDVRRDPMDCCFSNWKQLYARGLDHSNALDTMGRYYSDYVRLMRHFDKVQPGAVHRVIYEDLVDDLEGEARRILAYLDLDFDPAVLAFHQTDRAVRTISAGQVRQPINRKGLAQWTPFEQWLEPLKTSLGDIRETWRK
jgi:tetratricopeptide (TPR) repeat protein